MKSKFWAIVVTMAGALAAVSAGSLAAPQSGQDIEYQVKAAFLFNFIKFVEWHEEKTEEGKAPGGTFTIGVIGKNTFDGAFDPIKDKEVRGRKVRIESFGSFKDLLQVWKWDPESREPTLKALKQCHILFVSAAEKEQVPEILALVKNGRVLTVGESDGFLDAGGIVRFVMDENKVRFEVNFTAAKLCQYKISSHLLKLATKVL